VRFTLNKSNELASRLTRANKRLIIFLAAALTSNAVHVSIELLVGHLRPGEEEPAGRTVLQAILGGALVEVQLSLDDPRQACDAKMRIRKATPWQAAF